MTPKELIKILSNKLEKLQVPKSQNPVYWSTGFWFPGLSGLFVINYRDFLPYAAYSIFS